MSAITQEQIEFVRTWVAALRSGRYRQVRGVLHNEQGYCALGVAIDVSGRGEWSVSQFRYDGLTVFTCEEILKVGVQQFWNELLGDRDRVHGVADLNDRGDTFDQIADEIERRFPEVFAKPVDEYVELDADVGELVGV